MKTLTKQQAIERYKQFGRWSNTLKTIPEESWSALMGVINDEHWDADERTTELGLHDSARTWWAGFEKALKDLPETLNELRFGAWEQWPEMAGAKALVAEEEET